MLPVLCSAIFVTLLPLTFQQVSAQAIMDEPSQHSVRHTHNSHPVTARHLSPSQNEGRDTKPIDGSTRTYSAAVAPGGVTKSSITYVRTGHQISSTHLVPNAILEAQKQTPAAEPAPPAAPTPPAAAPIATTPAVAAPVASPIATTETAATTVAAIVAASTTALLMRADTATTAAPTCAGLPGVAPDRDQNCVCPDGFSCYEDRNVEAAQELASNLNNKSIGQEVINEVAKDQVKDGCTAHGAEPGKVISSRTKFRADCLHCHCHSATSSTSTAPPFTTPAGAQRTSFSMILASMMAILGAMMMP